MCRLTTRVPASWHETLKLSRSYESRPPADRALTWALMELFWTNERAAMAARPRPLPPPTPSYTPCHLL
ncbi:hypothetical protein J6590_077191, partial [Homalodisca vitripennis]